MSISYHTYIGPYVQCRVAFVDTPSYQVGCPNAGCPRYVQPSDGGRYCRHCGALIERVATTEQRAAVDTWALVDVIGQTLTNASGDAAADWSREQGAHLWYANVATGGREYHLETPEDFFVCEIAAGQIQAEIAAFEQQFASELALFRERYGADAVGVRWGIIQDYS